MARSNCTADIVDILSFSPRVRRNTPVVVISLVIVESCLGPSFSASERAGGGRFPKGCPLEARSVLDGSSSGEREVIPPGCGTWGLIVAVD